VVSARATETTCMCYTIMYPGEFEMASAMRSGSESDRNDWHQIVSKYGSQEVISRTQTGGLAVATDVRISSCSVAHESLQQDHRSRESHDMLQII